MSVAFLIYLIVLIAGALLGLVFWKKLSLAFRLITCNLIWTAFFEGLSRYSIDLEETYFRYNIYAPVYFILFVAAYCSLFRRNSFKWFPLIFAVVILLNSIISIVKNGMYVFSGIVITVDSFLLIICALLGFLVLLREPKNRPLKVEPVFWLHAAMIFYWSFSFFRNSVLNDFIKLELVDLSFYETVHTVISTLFYLVLALSIYLNFKINNDRKNA
jgi:hypothetical protein